MQGKQGLEPISPQQEAAQAEADAVALAAAAAFVVGGLLALPSLMAYFVADDFVSLYAVTQHPPWRFLWSNWVGVAGEGGFYRPVFNWVLGLCWLPFGLSPLPFRAVQVLLYACNCAFVVLLAHRATGSRSGSLAAGLLFAAHPVHGEAIGWLSSILEQLCAFFFLLSILCFDQAARRGRAALGSWLGLSAGLMALSLGSKEMGIAIPPVAVLWDFFLYRDRWEGKPLWKAALRRMRLWAPLIGLGAAYVVFRLIVLGGVGGYGDRHFNFGVVDNHLVHYLWFLMQPVPPGWLDRGAGGKGLVVAAAGLVGLAALWRAAGLTPWRGVALGIGWFFVTWAPVASLLRQQYMFLPSVGAAIAVGGAFGPLLDEARVRGQTALALAGTLVLSVWLVWSGNALLGQLKVWEAGGQIAREVLRQTEPALGGIPPQPVLVYEGLPVNIGVPVFQHGIQESLRLYTGRDDLVAHRLPNFKTLPAGVDPARARFLRWEKNTLHDVTVQTRAQLQGAPPAAP